MNVQEKSVCGLEAPLNPWSQRRSRSRLMSLWTAGTAPIVLTPYAGLLCTVLWQLPPHMLLLRFAIEHP